MTDIESGGYEGPAIVELMGHRRIAGHVKTVAMFGAELLRIDVPNEDGDLTTQFYGGAAIYCVTPTTPEMLDRIAYRNHPEPVAAWELREIEPAEVVEGPPEF